MTSKHKPTEVELAQVRRHKRVGSLWGFGLAVVIVGWVLIEVSMH